MAEVQCRHFNGYKPCVKDNGQTGVSQCGPQCLHRDIPRHSLLIVHLGALGAVLRSTALLPAIKRKYPSSRITWVTDSPANHLLKNNPFIDQVLTSSIEGLLELSVREFDVAFVIDKSSKAFGLSQHTRVKEIFGFTMNPKSGAIIPATEAARELWEIGLSDYKKFKLNTKTETQLIHEALGLGKFQRDEYQVFLTEDEKRLTNTKRASWVGPKLERDRSNQLLIGINTGCSPVGVPFKKLTVEGHRQLICEILKSNLGQVVLLGGPEDTERNLEIGQGLKVIQSPTDKGIRDGLTSVAACDVVVTGDSLGMHMAIALRKWVVAWFGPTCAHEIDLYDRGAKVLAQVSCGPCWKRLCDKTPMCYDQVSLAAIVSRIKEYQFGKESSPHTNSLHW